MAILNRNRKWFFVLILCATTFTWNSLPRDVHSLCNMHRCIPSETKLIYTMLLCSSVDRISNRNEKKQQICIYINYKRCIKLKCWRARSSIAPTLHRLKVFIMFLSISVLISDGIRIFRTNHYHVKWGDLLSKTHWFFRFCCFHAFNCIHWISNMCGVVLVRSSLSFTESSYWWTYSGTSQTRVQCVRMRVISCELVQPNGNNESLQQISALRRIRA